MSDDKPEVVHTTETSATPAERAELHMAAEPKPDEPVKNDPQEAADGHVADGDHSPEEAEDEAHAHGHAHAPEAPSHIAHAGDHGHGLAHTMPLPLLFGVLGALLVLTFATVSVTSIDLGSQGNLIVGMIIATMKAALVVTFFMHLLWDKKFNLVLFLTSVMFLILFLSMVSTDRGEYQHLVDEYRAQQLLVK